MSKSMYRAILLLMFFSLLVGHQSRRATATCYTTIGSTKSSRERQSQDRSVLICGRWHSFAREANSFGLRGADQKMSSITARVHSASRWLEI